MNKLLFIAVLSVLVASGCVQNSMSPYPECIPHESKVDDAIISGLEDSEYMGSLVRDGFTLQRFRGSADSCSEIPDNYVHLNFMRGGDPIYTTFTVQTQCDPSTLTCDFKTEDLMAQLDYLNSMEFIASGDYEKSEVHWLFGQDDRVRYYKDISDSGHFLDIYLVDNKIVRAVEYAEGVPLNSPIDRCADESLTCG